MQFGVPQYQDIKLIECPKKGYEDDEGSRGVDIRREAEVPGFAQPRAEQAEGRPHGGSSSLTRGAEGQALSSALWGQRQDPRERHGAGTGEGQAGG